MATLTVYIASRESPNCRERSANPPISRNRVGAPPRATNRSCSRHGMPSLAAGRSAYGGEPLMKFPLMAGAWKGDHGAPIENVEPFANQPRLQDAAHILLDQNQRRQAIGRRLFEVITQHREVALDHFAPLCDVELIYRLVCRID